MKLSRETFGPTLKAERDRRGITLQAIAESTKISISLLAALERNDVSRWPKGIFRRAFVREYVAAIGLAPDVFVDEFSRLFSDGPRIERADISEFRLTLEDDLSASWSGLRRRVLFSAAETLGVLIVGCLVAWLFGVPVWAAAGGVALAYYPISNVVLERTSGPRLVFLPLVVSWFEGFGFLGDRRPAVNRDGDDGPISEAHEAEEPTTPPSGEWRTAHH